MGYTLITGGTEGIGLELAKLYAKDGHNLIIVARNIKKLKGVKKSLEDLFNIHIEIISLDLSVNNSCEKLYEFVEKNNLIVDNLINNAGIGSFGFFNELNIDNENKLIKINIEAVFNITYYFYRKMINRGQGSILNVASTAAFSSGPKMSTYYASKAYVLSLTEALYEEGRIKGVKVSCLCPGAVRTEFQNKSGIIKGEKSKGLIMEASDVARIAYRDFNKGKAIIIPGFKNKVLVYVNKLLPRRLTRKIVFNVNN